MPLKCRTKPDNLKLNISKIQNLVWGAHTQLAKKLPGFMKPGSSHCLQKTTIISYPKPDESILKFMQHKLIRWESITVNKQTWKG